MGFFNKIKEAFQKKIYEVFTAKELNDEFYEELEYALISSDLGAEATAQILDDFKEKCFENRIKKPEEAKELLKEIMTQSIDYEVEEYSYPLIILVAGVNGVGKTTALGKLARFFKNKGKSVVLAAADTFRAAAADQLQVWADRSDVRLIRHEEGSDAAAVVFDALSSAKAKNTDVVLIDTAGRLQNKKNLMNELSKINKVVEKEYPDADYRTFIVIDATTGQNAISQVEAFDEIIDIDGIVLNKLDGTAKGGVVFAISAEKEMPVLYCGVGEGVEDIYEFNAKDFVDSLF